ncbi:MAG: sugar ABC transporter permease [Synechococcales cyanobacterium RM1_1_8]|nr:sugar ABC transporter permease [Synechococcales cyanobacterium RM1_1_8]
MNRSSPATPYLFLLPALAILTVTVFGPALQAFYYSFTDYDLLSPPRWNDFANFQRLWRDPVFWKALWNTVLYLACVVPLLVTLPLGLAILVNRKLRGIHWFRLAYYAPVVISVVVAGITWRWLYTENGLFNQLGQSLLGQGALAQAIFPIPWLTSPKLALFSIMAVTVWKGLGYYMVVYLAGLQAIPGDLYEAAAIDGSDGWVKHWDITLPLMRPYVLLVAVISSISAAKVFEEIYVMAPGGGPSDSTKTMVYYVYDLAFGKFEMSYACTVGLALFLLILVPSLLRLTLGGPIGNA